MLPDRVSNPGPLTYESGLKKKKAHDIADKLNRDTFTLCYQAWLTGKYVAKRKDYGNGH